MAKRKEIYKYEAPWTVYSMNWSVRQDKRFRLAIGSFVEEYNNKVSLRAMLPSSKIHGSQCRYPFCEKAAAITLALAQRRFEVTNRCRNVRNAELKCAVFAHVFQVQIVALDEESSEFKALSTFDHPYPTTKLMWIPDSKGTFPDLLATSGDYLRVWKVVSNSETRLECLLNNVSPT